MAQDSFERAREAFFGTAKVAPSPHVLRGEFRTHKTEPLAIEAANTVPNGYSGVLLSSSMEIRLLKDVARRLIEQDEAMLDPEFFLASIPMGWAPRVVAVYREHDVVGIMYTRERIISGVPTGIVYIDGSLDGFLLANELHRRNTFRVAMETLFSSAKIRGMRLRLLGDKAERDVVRQLVASRSLDAQYSRIEHQESLLWKHHAHLRLADTYDQFLKRLGPATRHNFRYYRRRFERSGHIFMQRLSLDELRLATLDLIPKSKFTCQWRHRDIRKALKMLAAASRPLAIGLKHRNGEWLSVIGGWYKPDGAVLSFQCNNECDFGPDSLSIVVRGYLIELLIRQGMNELVISGGTGPPLSRYVSYPSAIGVRLDVPTYSWRAARLLISTIGPYLPKRLAAAARWIS